MARARWNQRLKKAFSLPVRLFRRMSGTRLRPDWLVNASRHSSQDPYRVKLEGKGIYGWLYERGGKIIMSVQEYVQEEHGPNSYLIETRVYSPEGKLLSRRKA